MLHSSTLFSSDIDDLARRTIADEFGYGGARKRALGANYATVQARVSQMLNTGGPASRLASDDTDIDALVRAVIRGYYGNGEERKRRLGSLYGAVRARVNQLLS